MTEHSPSNPVLKKADAYCWMAHWGGESRGYVPADGNWVKYGDYVALWDAYQALRHEIKGLRAEAQHEQPVKEDKEHGKGRTRKP